MLTFRVDGRPVPQGNHRAVSKGVVREATKGHKAWREAVHWAAKQALRASAFSDGEGGYGDAAVPGGEGVVVWAKFTFKTPKRGHKHGDVRPCKPDLDKLNRAIGDSLESAGVVANDSQIVGWPCCPAKVYGVRPGAEICVYTLEEWEGRG